MIQDEIEVWTQDATDQRQVLFDLTCCVWIDPLPLLSVLIEATYAKERGCSVKVQLPEPVRGNPAQEVGPYQKHHNRLLLFLAAEGFLQQLAGRKVEILSARGKAIPPEGNFDQFIDLPVKPSYQDATCIPVRIFDVPGEQERPSFAADAVDHLTKSLDLRLRSKIPPVARDRLLYKLTVALQETLHNVQEHAYGQGDRPRLIALYARYRNGGFGLDETGGREFEALAREERQRCPRLTSDWLETRTGCIEVFILDRGQGMVNSFAKLPDFKFEHKYRLNEVMRLALLAGQSTKGDRKTKFGGLHLLHNFLSDTGDYVRALDDRTWYGSAAPLQRVRETTHMPTGSHRGLAWHLRLGWKEETDTLNGWLELDRDDPQKALLEELKLDERECKDSIRMFESWSVVDERFDGGLYRMGNGVEGWLLWLVQPHRMKWDIRKFLEQEIAPAARTHGSRIRLVIADIPNYEAATYEAALAESSVSKINDPWPSAFREITLVTRRWRFANFRYEEDGSKSRHGFSKRIVIESEFRTPSTGWAGVNVKNVRRLIVRWVKWHDSRRLWEELQRRGVPSLFLPGEIKWGTGDDPVKVINGYLDFPQSCRVTLCADIYRASLSRAVGVLNVQSTEMVPIDRLVAPILQDVLAEELQRPSVGEPHNRIALGSVLVSGTTLASSIHHNVALHFFVRPECPPERRTAALLYWVDDVSGWGIEKRPLEDGVQPPLERVGKTAIVAPGGWKSFEVPRFYQDDESCVGGRTPEDSYKDWQSTSPVIVKVGHWRYEGHHDFLTVNLPDTVEDAFLRKNDLARFLVRHIHPFLGLAESDLQPAWRRFLEGSRVGEKREPGILVYRSHPSSEHVIRRLLELLTDEGKEIALRRVFPVLPIRTRWSGSTLLIPPLVRRDIGRALASAGQEKRVLIFDDAAITGRTLADLRAALGALGALRIETIVIVNRLRLPADARAAENLQYYWRLDVPTMGREGHCPFCQALHVAHSFKSSLVSRRSVEEIESWEGQWGAASPLSRWNAGLHPIPLAEPILNKGFCYRQSLQDKAEEDRYLARIDLIRSTGLAINIAELHAMTGRDDYGLAKIRAIRESDVRVELAASQLLLFGDEFERDVCVEFIHILLNDLSRLPRDSSHAPLAALAILAALDLLSEPERSVAISSLPYEIDWENSENHAARVLLAYLIREGLVEEGAEKLACAARLLSARRLDFPGKLNVLFRETMSPEGDPHSEPIPRLLGHVESGNEIHDWEIGDALDSVDRLNDLVAELGRDKTRSDALGHYQECLEEFQAAIIAARTAATGYMNAKIESDIAALGDAKEEIRKALLKITSHLEKMASFYCHIITDTEQYSFEKSFENAALATIGRRIDWNAAWTKKQRPPRECQIALDALGAIAFGQNKKVWIPWHRGIVRIVQDLITNAVNSAGPIQNPFSRIGGNEEADMWLRVDYFDNAVQVSLANKTNDNPDRIYAAMKEKGRWADVDELGGTVEVTPQDARLASGQGIVEMRIRIPYVAYVRPRKD